MQSSPSLSPSLHNQFAEIAIEVNEKLKMEDSENQNREVKREFEAKEEEQEEKEDEDEDFSFVCNGAKSPIFADDAFEDGQIRPSFPLFNRDLLLGDDDSMPDLPFRPPVNRIFIETRDNPPSPSSSAAETEEFSGPYCEWSKKAVDASPDSCKKSSSTGFSKIWRFREFVSRSNSDGRDAFVFLNGSTPTTTSTKRDDKVEKPKTSSEKKSSGAGEVKASGGAGGGKSKAKKGEKADKSSLSAHYARNRALKEEDRRRSYLPYRPELVGFFTNVNGGMSRNVHPF